MTDETQPALFNLPQTTRTSDDYWTPTWLFDVMGLRFDLDVAAPEGGAPWVPADRYYAQSDNGLTSPWYGKVWMNPPYSNTTPWADKFREHANGVALVPVAKSYWTTRVWESDAAIVLAPSNLKFQQGTIFLPTMLVAYGPDNIEAISRIGKVR